MRHVSFEIPVDYRERRHIECGMGEHQHENAPCARKDRPEHEPDDCPLLGAWESLLRVVSQPKQNRGDQHDHGLGREPGTEEFTETLEHESPEHGFFPPSCADGDSEQHPRKRGRVAHEVVIGLIDRIGAEQRHDDRFHQKLEGDAERDADNQAPGAARRTHVADLAPWRTRPQDPQYHQHGTEGRHNRVAREDSENRNDSDRSDAAQLPGEAVVIRHRSVVRRRRSAVRYVHGSITRSSVAEFR